MSASLENLRCLSVLGFSTLPFFVVGSFFTHISFNLDHQKGVLWQKLWMCLICPNFSPDQSSDKGIKTTRPGFISITPLWRSCAHFTSEKEDTSLFHRKRGRASLLLKEISSWYVVWLPSVLCSTVHFIHIFVQLIITILLQVRGHILIFTTYSSEVFCAMALGTSV